MCVFHCTQLQVEQWITSGKPSPSAPVDATALSDFMNQFASLRGDPVATIATTDKLELIDREVRPHCLIG